MATIHDKTGHLPAGHKQYLSASSERLSETLANPVLQSAVLERVFGQVLKFTLEDLPHSL
jgi:hypothetical protein